MRKKVKKRVRTISGITIVSVMTKPHKCPKKEPCIYCPGGIRINMPQSYVPKSPVVLRAEACNYDPEKQVKGRLRVLSEMGHKTEKNEIIVMGGTFLSTDLEYQKRFIKGCFDGLNGIKAKSLEDAQKLNENAERRCVGLCIETRPDVCGENEINNMLSYGTTRVELGVQTLDDKIYEFIKRGHKVKDVIKATQLLKDSGFKVIYHTMPNLPGSNPEKDFKTWKKLFEDQNFRPDGVKIYPTQVCYGTELLKIYEKGLFKPYKDEELINLLVKMKSITPKWVRIMKVMRDTPIEYVRAGCKIPHLRDVVKERMKDLGLKCSCIRCREVGHALRENKKINLKAVELLETQYKASNGKEIFLSFEDKENEILIGLLRLRFPYKPFRPEIKNSSLVRELHVYGPEIGFKEKSKFFQHKGYGKKLLKEAERISKENNYDKIVIISGIGVREYYRKLGYKLEGPYMVKNLKT